MKLCLWLEVLVNSLMWLHFTLKKHARMPTHDLYPLCRATEIERHCWVSIITSSGARTKCIHMHELNSLVNVAIWTRRKEHILSIKFEVYVIKAGPYIDYTVKHITIKENWTENSPNKYIHDGSKLKALWPVLFS